MTLYEVSIVYDQDQYKNTEKHRQSKSIKVATRETMGIVVAKALHWASQDPLPKLVLIRQFDKNMKQVDQVVRYQRL